MTSQTTTATDRDAADHKRSPRPGRSHCIAVDSYDCLAPAGFRTMHGSAAAPGVRAADLYECGYCGEKVCHECSTDFGDLGRVCTTHSDDETADWIAAHERADRRRAAQVPARR